MTYKLPKIIKCCCCIPLDYGVIVSVYVKIILDLVFLAYVFIILVPLVYKTIYYVGADITEKRLLNLVFMAGLLIIDVIMNATFIVSSKLKNYKLMKMYYYYTIYMFTFSILYFTMGMFSELYFVGHYIFNSRRWREIFQEIIFGMITLGLQFYFILMIRIKLLKIKRYNNKSELKKSRMSKIECNSPEPGPSSTKNFTNLEKGFELKEIISAPSKILIKKL